VCDILADGHQTRNVGFIASYHPMLAHWTRLHPRLRIALEVGLTTTTRDCGRQLQHTMTNYLINPCRPDAGLGHVACRSPIYPVVHFLISFASSDGGRWRWEVFQSGGGAGAGGRWRWEVSQATQLSGNIHWTTFSNRVASFPLLTTQCHHALRPSTPMMAHSLIDAQ
jgi:hypothetical protein